MEEIKRLQQLAGIITEVKVNNPLTKGLSMEEFYELRLGVEEEFENYRENIGENEIEDFNNYLDKVENTDTIQDLDDALEWLYSGDKSQVEETKDHILKGLQEDVSKFKVGQTTQAGGHKSTVTDVDPTTQSVTWNIKKEISDKEIWDDLTKLLNKFEAIHLKDFHSRPKLNSLIRDLKTLRNKFSRTVVKEDRNKIVKQIVGVLNEIKVNNPNKPVVYIDGEQPYIPLKDGKRLYGYWGDDENNFSIEDADNDDFDEAIKYLGNSAELIDDGRTHYLLVYNKDVNIK